MMVVSRGRLLSKGSFPLMAGTRAWDLGGFLARLKGHGGAPGVEFMDRPDGLVRASSWRRLVVMDSGLVRPRWHRRLPPIRKNGSTRGLRLGIDPDSHLWADTAHGGPEAR